MRFQCRNGIRPMKGIDTRFLSSSVEKEYIRRNGIRPMKGIDPPFRLDFPYKWEIEAFFTGDYRKLPSIYTITNYTKTNYAIIKYSSMFPQETCHD